MEVVPGVDLMARLPAELFLLVLQEALPMSHLSVGTPYYSRLITISSVCKSWRLFVISTPSFWRFIGRSRERCSDRMMRLAFERCGRSPLEVVLELDNEANTWPQWQRAVLTACGRWKKADLSYMDSSQQDEDRLDILTQGTAPLLEELRLRDAWDDWDSPASPLKNLFSNTTPRLRRLEMSGVLLLPSSGFPSLRSLRITDDSEITILVPQLSRLLAICTNLSGLELADVQVNGPGALRSEETHFELPHLQNLILWNCAGAIASALLRPAAIPSCRRIFATIPDHVHAERMLEVVEGFAPLIRTCFEQDPQVFVAFGDRWLCLGLDWPEWHQRPTCPFFYISFEFSDFSSSANHVHIPRCLRLVNSLDLSRDSESLRISLAVECPLSEDIIHGPCRWPSITEFTCRPERAIWDILRDPLGKDDPNGPLAFPRLRRLEIPGGSFLRNHWLEAWDTLHLRTKASREGRGGRCVPLEALTMALSDGDKKMIDLLKGLLKSNSGEVIGMASWEKDPTWVTPEPEPVMIDGE